MGSFNKILLLGNVTRDIEVKYSASGSAYAQWGLATNRAWTNAQGEKQEETCFVDIKAFGRTAEIAGEYLKKGSPVFIEGRLSLYQWEDDAGQKRSKHSVTVESLQLLPRNGGGQHDAPVPRDEERPQQERKESEPSEYDEIPF